MVTIFRGMLGEGEKPRGGTKANCTQARIPQDVVTYDEGEQAWVSPRNGNLPNNPLQGLSVVTGNGCNLPPFGRPKNTTWNGIGSPTKMHVWSVDTGLLAATLTYLDDPVAGDKPWQTLHGLIAPAQRMPLADYQRDLALVPWTLVAPPEVACPVADQNLENRKDAGNAMDAEIFEAAISKAIAKGRDGGDALGNAVLEANSRGMNRDAVLQVLTALAQRLDEQDDEDGASEVWSLCNRVVGFTSAHSRLNLK